ncbi:MAG: hypothetical protein RBQ97_11920 [Acholeplasma sp.]|nr:hypothetical protein [Acholeplasma sp.]
MYLFLKLKPKSELYVDDVSKIKKYEGTPSLIKIRNEELMNIAIKKIEDLRKEFELSVSENVSENPLSAHPKLSKEQLIKKGLIKEVYTTKDYIVDK